VQKTLNSSDVNNFFPLNKERDRKDEGDVRISKYFNKESSGNIKKEYGEGSEDGCHSKRYKLVLEICVKKIILCGSKTAGSH